MDMKNLDVMLYLSDPTSLLSAYSKLLGISDFPAGTHQSVSRVFSVRKVVFRLRTRYLEVHFRGYSRFDSTDLNMWIIFPQNGKVNKIAHD